jgi:ABC-type transport system substrate-binding protein
MNKWKLSRIMKDNTLNNWLNVLILIGMILCSAFFLSLFTIFPPNEPKTDYPWKRITVGYSSNIEVLDPLDTWDDPSRIMQHQIVEGLVDYNYSDHPNYAIIPKLATNWHYHNSTEISFKLRENVFFHDYTKWNADVAIWNLERLMYFCNYTGTLKANATSWEAFPASLYYFSNGTPLFKFFQKNSEYNFTIFLNGPFAAILDLLTFSTTYMLSPKSTPRYRFLDLTREKLVGTGPFKYVRFKKDTEVRFEINSDYWGSAPWANTLIFRIIEDEIERMDAALAGQLDYVGEVSNSYISIFHSDPYFTVKQVGEDLCYNHLEFYSGPPFNYSADELEPIIKNGNINQKLNSTWRRALALSINYTHIWENLKSGYEFPGYPAVSPSTPSYNNSLDGKMAHDYPFDGTYNGNVKKARELMQSMSFGIGWDTNYPGNNETEWTSATFRTLEVNQHSGIITNEKLNQLLEINWNLIGIKINITIRMLGPTLSETLHDTPPWEVDVVYFIWCSDYLDAFSIFDHLFNNESKQSNWIQINDPILKDALETAAKTIDPIARQNIYEWIQSYIFDITRLENPSSYCHAPLCGYKVQQVHSDSLKGVGYNIMRMLDCWNWYIEYR